MKRLRRKAPLLGIAVLLLVAFVGGTFAYFSQTSTAENYLTALNYDSTITEAFTPPADGAFAPGVEIDKAVGVTNSGQVPMLVRITYDEYWSNLTYPIVSKLDSDGLADYGDAVTGVYDGAGDTDSYVQKNGFDADLWVYGGDGYYYYLAEVLPGTATTPFIKSIMLKMETTTPTTSYVLRWWDASLTTPAFVEETFTDITALDARKLEISALGGGSYLVNVISSQNTNAPEGSYTLTFTTETVQAIEEGADAWLAGTTPITTPAVLTFLNAVY